MFYVASIILIKNIYIYLVKRKTLLQSFLQGKKKLQKMPQGYEFDRCS